MLNFLKWNIPMSESIPIYVKCKVCKYIFFIINAIYSSNESKSHRERNKSAFYHQQFCHFTGNVTFSLIYHTAANTLYFSKGFLLKFLNFYKPQQFILPYFRAPSALQYLC